MNIYDEAYALAKALKESDEQKRLVEAEKALKTNPDAKKMTAEYLVLQQKVSYLQMMHEKDKAEKEYKKLQDMAVLVSNNELAAAYVQAFIRWNQMTSDINKIVVDAMTGQDAANTAKAFNEALPLTGVVLTKVDGDARGGAALSIRHITGKPIKFLGVGEKTEALEPFHPDRIASRILGMGDVLSLIEDIESKVDRAQAEKLASKLKKGDGFDLNDFLEQLRQMKNMGGMASLMGKLPGMGQIPDNVKSQMDDKVLVRMEAIINSMTMKERAKPEIIKGSRKRRIAAGCGMQVQDVNRLLKQFDDMQRMMKKMKKGGMAKMMRSMKGMMPPGFPGR